jgi:HK97 gp10 family phage protein
MLIKVINLDKCIKKFGDIGDLDLTPEIIEGARKVQGTAKKLAPVGTPESTGIKGYVGGTLRASISRKLYKQQQSAIVYTLVEYASYQEFGTSKMEAQPYLIPAMNINRAGIQQSMKKYIRDHLKKESS